MHVWFYDFVLIRSWRTQRLWCKIVTCLIVCFSQLQGLNPQQDTGDIWEQLAGLSELCASLHRSHSKYPVVSSPRGSLRPVYVKRWDWRSFYSQKFYLTCPCPKSISDWCYWQDILLCRRNAKVHGSVFVHISWNFTSLFCFLALGKTTSVESNSILRSHPVLLERRPWPKTILEADQFTFF